MIKFINIEDANHLGELYDGSMPFIHWVGDGLSTSLMYSKKICFLSDKPSIRCHMDDNEVFHLLDLMTYDASEVDKVNNEIIHDFSYKDIKQFYISSKIFRGYKWHEYYLYCIYILVSANEAGEYREYLHIGEDMFLVGADFYQENESLYINLSNFGQDIPEAIQKAILEVNVHEDYTDNITINRKWKELLSNYWDVIANKGSYKSLINSLKWFEWGDWVRLREIWKRNSDGLLEERNLSPILADQFKSTLQFYNKTTNIALYAARQTLSGDNEWDDEFNPELGWISSQWSWEDLALKMCMLGNFYETYFMPIHLDLIRATLEDVVFTTTIKQISSTHLDREDVISTVQTFTCNVRNGDTFTLHNVTCQAGPKTCFASNYTSQTWDTTQICGVEHPSISHLISTDADYKTFSINKFGGIGVIVDFECEISLNDEDFVSQEVLMWQPKVGHQWECIRSYNIYTSNTINFSLLFQEDREYDLRIQFLTAQGMVFTKKININICDVRGCSLDIFKVKRVDYVDGQIPEDLWNISPVVDYVFAHQQIPYSDQYTPIKQYIPVLPETQDRNNWTGLCLNHCLIIELPAGTQTNYEIPKYIQNNYFTQFKTSGGSLYLIGVSKTFWFEPSSQILKNYNVYRSEYIYVPQFHILEKLGMDNKKESFEVTQYDSLVVIPQFVYGKNINSWEWAIRNVTVNPHGNWVEIGSLRNPFVADIKNKPLPAGYYDIIFTFKFDDNVEHKIELNSAFHRI